jgi:hypothetical protein
MSDADKYTVAEYRAIYQQKIEARKREIAELEQKLQMLDVFAADAKIIFEPSNKYENWTLTPAVINAVISLHKIGVSDACGVEALEIQKYLEKHGFKVSDNFAIAIHTTVNRLSSKYDGRLEMKRDAYGKKKYKPSAKLLAGEAGKTGYVDAP